MSNTLVKWQHLWEWNRLHNAPCRQHVGPQRGRLLHQHSSWRHAKLKPRTCSGRNHSYSTTQIVKFKATLSMALTTYTTCWSVSQLCVLYERSMKLFLWFFTINSKSIQTAGPINRLVCIIQWLLCGTTKLLYVIQMHSTAQSFSRRRVTSEDRFRPWTTSCEIYGGQSGTGKEFSPSSSVFLSQYHSNSALHSYSSWHYSYHKDERAQQELARNLFSRSLQASRT